MIVIHTKTGIRVEAIDTLTKGGLITAHYTKQLRLLSARLHRGQRIRAIKKHGALWDSLQRLEVQIQYAGR